MGVNITDLLVHHEIELSDLAGKTLVVDAPMWLYQFLTSIRGPDGDPLKDSHGRITSHLMGISTRIPRLMEKGLKLAFCFDGKIPELKQHERERRREMKQHAEQQYAIAEQQGDVAAMRTFAARTTRLTSDLIQESQELLTAFGLPVIVAASEAEAQAAYIVKNGDAYAVASNDADCFLFEAPRVIRNLSLVGKKKKTKALSYESVKPLLIEHKEVLKNLGITQDQLIVLAMLIGTDYDVGGIKGIGPKNALKLVKQYPTLQDFDALFIQVKWNEFFEYPWREVFGLIKHIPVHDHYKLIWKPVQKEKIMAFLCEQHDFSKERVEGIIKKLTAATAAKQKGLSEFL